jgi:transposase
MSWSRTGSRSRSWSSTTGLDHVSGLKGELETFLYAQLTDLTNLSLTLVCYDLTSTFFEGDPSSSVKFPSKAFGYSRDRRGDRPQVVVGLLTTGDGIPIAHHVFAGDTTDVTTLPEVLEDLQKRFAVGRICLVADRGLISETNVATVAEAGADWIMATRLHQRADVAAVLEQAHAADDQDWTEVEQFSSRVLDLEHEGRRYVVVFSNARHHRDTLRRSQLVTKTEDQLLALEARVASGRLKDRDKIVAAAERILARSPVAKLFTYTAKEGRFVYDYDHDALDYEEDLAGHYVLATSLDSSVPAGEVLACYRSLQQVEHRFRVLKDFLHLRPVFHWTESRVRGHIAICVLAAVIEALIGKALADADVRDPDLDDQQLTAARALAELARIRQVTLDPGDGGPTIQAVTRRTALQQQILKALEVDTRAWQRPTITS